jgi:anti-sigma-K factor RskA
VRVWGWGTAAALAALIVAAIGLGAHIANLRGRMAALEAELRKTALAAARDRQSLEDLRRAVDEADAARLVLGATDLARIDLKAEAAAAGARARAFWNRSSGLVFTASALPTVPDGKVYQLWVLTAGDPVSAGLLRPDPGGSVDLFVKTPLDLPAPVGMAVTVEPSGGVPQPTGERILLGLE